MTITTTDCVVTYAGDGTANPLPINFPFFADDELEVIQTIIASGAQTTLVLGSDYTVDGGDDDVGTVTPSAVRPVTVTWTIKRSTERLQQTDYPPNDDFPAEAHEEALDRLTMIVQEIDAASGRAIQAPASESGTFDGELPAAAARANMTLGFDASGNVVVGGIATAPVSSAMMPVVAAASIAAAAALLGISQVGGAGQAPTSGGSANAQTLAYSPAVSAYALGLPLNFVAGFTNTGPATINVNGLGAKNIFVEGKALSGGELVAGSLAQLVYDGVQFQLVSRSFLSDMPWGMRNVLMNGGAEVWQRGAGGSASIAVAASTTAYCEDRSYIITGANQAHVVSQQAGLTNTSRYCARVQRNSGQTGTGAMVKAFPLTSDQVQSMNGSIVAFRAKVRSGANWSPASGNLTLTLYVGTAAEAKRGGGFTGETNVASATVALGTSSAVTDSAAVSAAVVPANATQGELRFSWAPVGTAGANDYFEHDDIQLELGGVASAFERRPFDVELAQCQRFYRKTFPYGAAPAQNAGTAGCLQTSTTNTAGVSEIYAMWRFGTVMRVTPTLTAFNPSAANALWRNITAGSDSGAASFNNSGDEGTFVVNATAPNIGAQNTFGIHATADAEL